MSNPKEQAYDTHIAPLMSEIIRLCKEHKINMAAQFALDPKEDGEPLFCTTALPIDKADARGHEQIVKVASVMRPRTPIMAITIVGGGAK